MPKRLSYYFWYVSKMLTYKNVNSGVNSKTHHDLSLNVRNMHWREWENFPQFLATSTTCWFSPSQPASQVQSLRKWVGTLGPFWTKCSSHIALILDSVLCMKLEPFFNPYPSPPLPNNVERCNMEVDNMTPIIIVRGDQIQ